MVLCAPLPRCWHSGEASGVKSTRSVIGVEILRDRSSVRLHTLHPYLKTKANLSYILLILKEISSSKRLNQWKKSTHPSSL